MSELKTATVKEKVKRAVETERKLARSKAQERQAELTGTWHYTLFECCSRDWEIGITGALCCPCKTCVTASKVSDNKYTPCMYCLFCWLPCCNPCVRMRTEFRIANNIPGDCGNDCLIGVCCAPCSLCQIENELDREKRLAKAGGPGREQMPALRTKVYATS